MRKLVLAACGLCAGLLLAGPGQAQEEECRAIVAKAIKAVGSEEKLAAFKASQSKAKGTISIQGMEFEFTVESFSQPPDKYKIVADLNINNNNVQVIQVF